MLYYYVLFIKVDYSSKPLLDSKVIKVKMMSV